MAPVFNGGVVYVGSKNRTVYGVSVKAGRKVWSGRVGSVILPPNELGVGVRAAWRPATVGWSSRLGPS